MMELVLFLAGSIGLAHVLVDGHIFAWLRDWLREPTLHRWLSWLAYSPSFMQNSAKWLVGKVSEMINCHQCCGFWTGLLCAWLTFSEIHGWQILVGGFAGSFLSMFFAILFNYLEAQTVLKFPPNESPPPK